MNNFYIMFLFKANNFQSPPISNLEVLYSRSIIKSNAVSSTVQLNDVLFICFPSMLCNFILLYSGIETSFKAHAPYKGSVQTQLCENATLFFILLKRYGSKCTRGFSLVQTDPNKLNFDKCARMHQDILCM